MALIDACVRLLPGVMGAEASLTEESFENGLLEYPHYTRPRVWKASRSPTASVGRSCPHRAMAREQAETITRQRRPDLLPVARKSGGDY